jgi:hypothetical protein
MSRTAFLGAGSIRTASKRKPTRIANSGIAKSAATADDER